MYFALGLKLWRKKIASKFPGGISNKSASRHTMETTEYWNNDVILFHCFYRSMGTWVFYLKVSMFICVINIPCNREITKEIIFSWKYSTGTVIPYVMRYRDTAVDEYYPVFPGMYKKSCGSWSADFWCFRLTYLSTVQKTKENIWWWS